MSLVHDDLWSYVTTTPAATDVEATKKDQRARAKICLMINTDLLVHVREATTTKEVWQALENNCQDQGVVNRCRLLGQLVSFKLEQFSCMKDYVTQILKVAQQLRDIGKEVDDELLAALMLQGLTEEYTPLKMTIENANITLTSNYVKTKLLQQDSPIPSTSTENALIARDNRSRYKRNSTNSKGNQQKQTQQKAEKQKKEIRCFICNGPHKALICPKNPNANKEEKGQTLLAAYSTIKSNDNEWVVDSGASSNMTYNKDWLANYKDFNSVVEINVANGQKLYACGSGDVIKDENMQFGVREVKYVPGLSANLLSVDTLVSRNFTVVFSEKGCDIYDKSECCIKGKVICNCKSENGIYKFKSLTKPNSALTVSMPDDYELWHKRLAHLGVPNMKLLRDGMATGVSFKNPNILQCEPCLKGKQTRTPFSKSSTTRSSEILELIHSDICGPMSMESHGGMRYFLLFIDDKTRYTFVYFLKKKSEVFSKLVEFKSLVENLTNKKIKKFRSDNGKEFVNKAVSQLFKENGIVHQLTIDYCPEQNGVAERANRTLVEKAKCMLEEAGLSTKYWAEAINTAVFLKNRSPTKALNVTPLEAWSGQKPDLSELKVFGCKAFMHIDKAKRKKLDAKSKEMIFVGYCMNSKGYRLCDPHDHKLQKSRDVTFFENQFFNKRENTPPRENTVRRFQNLEREINEIQQQYTQEHSNPSEQITTTETVTINTEEDYFEDCITDSTINEEPDIQVERLEIETIDVQEEQPPETQAEERRYPQRERKAKDYGDYYLYKVTEGHSDDPLTVEEALSRNDKDKWQEAIDAELDALKKNGTWTLVKPDQSLNNFNVVDSKWIFKIKKEPGGKERYKARLVARGFTQKYGLDYTETFSPVIRHSTLRLLFAIAVENDLSIDQMDVVTAFLNGDLTERVYMKQPKLCEEKGKENHICLLKKALYGLKQANRAWNKKLHDALIEMKFKRSDNEPCVYFRRRGNHIVYIAVYVDDILIFYNDKKEREKVKIELKTKFEMKDLGKVETFLGMKIDHQGKKITIDQGEYIQKILKEFGMTDCKPVKTPLEIGRKLEKPRTENFIPPKDFPYQKLIGSLMYLAVCSRPDISFAVAYLSQFNSCYTGEHWSVAKRLLRYLKGTAHYKLNFEKTGKDLTGYVDADHAGDISDRKSFSGYIFILGGAPISWESKKQRTVALSSAEAEYVAMSEACRESTFLKRLIEELTTKECHAIMLYSDSQSAIQIAKNPVHHQRTKHIDVRCHYIREALNDNIVKVEYLQTEEMTADILTKALPRCKNEFCVRGMNLCA